MVRRYAPTAWGLLLATVVWWLAAGMSARAGQASGPPGPPSGATGRWVLTGTVHNPYGIGIPGAEVELAALGMRVQADAGGRFRLEGRGSPGSVQVSVRGTGYLPRTFPVTLAADQELRLDFELAIDGVHFLRALEDVRLRLYREGGFSPIAWWVPRLGLVVRYTRPELRGSQDRLFEMFSAVIIAKEIMAPFPYLHDGDAQLISEAVTPSEHLLRRYPRGPLLEMLARGTPDIERALTWTQEHYEFYRNGQGQGREVPGWAQVQRALDAVTSELFREPEAGGVYVPGYGLLFNAPRAPQFPPVTALSVLSMLLALRVPIPEGDRIFVQLDDGEALWALEAPIQTLRRLLDSQQEQDLYLDLPNLEDLRVYRNGMPWGR
ncbi:MAG: carboxypeptidase regulatory-like domain-containing protein [Firmicutes bacterium]|nr:carboxypeptidase regulatory-like domain-containing protein [Bacillota bacterium]